MVVAKTEALGATQRTVGSQDAVSASEAPAGTAYQLLPPLSSEEYESLKADIAARGVQVPVEYDEAGNILDGHHRVRACLELGITEWPRVVRRGLTEAEKVEHVLALNLHRRHLTREHRRELVLRLRQQGWSLRRIAGRLGIGLKTVHRDATGVSNDTPATVTGADGKRYPATRQRQEQITEPEATDVLDVAAPVGEVTSPPPSPEPVGGQSPATRVEPERRPHVAYNTGDNEWYTPAEYIEAARLVMGGIDLDPASSPEANKVVRASVYYTAQDNGLTKHWRGRVWMNPPYSQPLIVHFCEKLARHWDAGDISAACVLVNNATETAWFQLLAERAVAICFPRGRVRFWKPGGEIGAPLQGQAVLYFGDAPDAFTATFRRFGVVLRT